MTGKTQTATVTWISYYNFGTFLQAYALQQMILKLGYANKILSDWHIVKPKSRPSLRIYIRKIKNYLLHRNKSERLYKQFKKKHLLIDIETSPQKIQNKYQIMLCGSDQIWSPYLKFEPYYYLNFFHGKKVAYAPSIGTSTWTKEYTDKIIPLLKQFSALSVREPDSASKLSEQLGYHVYSVLDPTLLFNGEEWKQRLLPDDKQRGGYILCYFLTPNSWYLNFVREYAKQQNKRIKIFETADADLTLGECTAAGPKEFLSLIYSADEVFTDSFHATIFSILFHKKFVTFKRFADGGDRDQNLRLYNLFENLKLQQYFIGETDLPRLHKLTKPDYREVEERLSSLRAESISYLRQSLNAQ